MKLGKKPRNKMPVSERAKQFSPFAAVTGLYKALEEAEREFFRAEKPELSEEAAAELNKVLSELKKGDSVEVEYYCDGEYLKAYGKVEQIDIVNSVLKVGERIAFDNILKLSFANCDLY